MGLMLIGIIIACYFFPSIIAAFRKHHNTLAIFLLNLFLGWTGIGWLCSLIWAATAVRAAQCGWPDRMMDLLVTALTFLIAIATSQAGYHLTKLVQDKWSKRKL